mgnify:CR=1 FL=1
MHKAFCSFCGKTGHLFGTHTLNATRFRINKKGVIVRKQNRAPLTTDDFMCCLMTDAAITNLVTNTQSEAAAKAIDAHERRVSTTRLLDNVNATGVDLDETIRLLEHKGTKAALLSDKNKNYFLNLSKRAHLGAIDASRIAAEAAESSLDEQASGDEGKDEAAGEKSAASKDAHDNGEKKLKAVSAIEKARKNRTDRNAHAIALGRARNRALRPRQPRLDNGTAAKGRTPAAPLGSGVDGVIDIDGTSSRVYRFAWPAGARGAFASPLPALFSPTLAANPPAKIAHMMLESMCQCAMGDVDEELGGMVIKGAVKSQACGYTLTGWTLSAAQVSEWLRAAMPGTMQASTLTPMARAGATVVDHAATAAGTAAGIKTPAQRPPAPVLGGEGV